MDFDFWGLWTTSVPNNKALLENIAMTNADNFVLGHDLTNILYVGDSAIEEDASNKVVVCLRCGRYLTPQILETKEDMYTCDSFLKATGGEHGAQQWITAQLNAVEKGSKFIYSDPPNPWPPFIVKRLY